MLGSCISFNFAWLRFFYYLSYTGVGRLFRIRCQQARWSPRYTGDCKSRFNASSTRPRLHTGNQSVRGARKGRVPVSKSMSDPDRPGFQPTSIYRRPKSHQKRLQANGIRKTQRMQGSTVFSNLASLTLIL